MGKEMGFLKKYNEGSMHNVYWIDNVKCILL
jgi:hypothetical protein